MQLDTNILQIFNKDWALVTAGDENNFNTMTIGWGSLGTLWSKPVATVYVKPIRYTHRFLEANDYFTVSFFGEQHRDALRILGTLSGSDCDKVTKSGLTPQFLPHGVSFCEAEVTIVCKKIYRQDMDLNAIPQDALQRYYQSEAPHTMFIGEVVDIIKCNDEHM